MDYRRERNQGIYEDVDIRTTRFTLGQARRVVEDGDVDRPTVAPSLDKHASESSTTPRKSYRWVQGFLARASPRGLAYARNTPIWQFSTRPAVPPIHTEHFMWL